MSSTRRGARCALAAATAWAALMAAPASAQSDIPLQPFPVNHELRIDSGADARFLRSEEHTSGLQSLMRISYAVFFFKQKHNVLLFLYYYLLFSYIFFLY